MTYNLYNALHGVQEARTALMLENGEAETLEEIDAIKEMEELLKEVERKIKVYGS